MLLLIVVIYKHKRRGKEEQYGVDDKVCYNPDVYPEVAFSDDPFGIQEMNEDEDVTVNIYDSIDNYMPIDPKGPHHYKVQQLPTPDEDEEQEDNTEEEVKASYDTAQSTQQDGEDTTAVQKAYEPLNPDTMMDKTDHQYQGTIANKDNDDYDIPLTVGHHPVNSSNTEKSVAEETYQHVDGEDNSVDEWDEYVDPDDDQQPLIKDDDISDQITATDEDWQNVGEDEDYQSMKDEDDHVSITDEDTTLI